MNFLRELPVLVLGLGDSGLAMVRWCVRHGAAVSVWDSREIPPQAETLAREFPGVALSNALPSLDAFRLVLKSPGLSPHDTRVAALLQAARDSGVALLGELDLFGHALHDLHAAQGYAPKLVAITGTNGKTTTTAMTAMLIERCGKRVASAGNIGPTMLDTLAAALDAGTLPEVWVLELSSFQLEGGGFGIDAGAHFAPDAAVVLNLSQDHLDWHGTMHDYAAAKARLYTALSPRGTVVLNRDDLQAMAMQPVPPPPAKGVKTGPIERPSLHFGLNAPQRPGDFGLVTESGMAWLIRALPSEEPARRRKAGAGRNAEELHVQRLMPADALRIRGRHNAANALAALALATAIGMPLAPMLHGLREYAGEPHRVQWVATVGDIDAFDDSKGTNVGATVAALEGLGAEKAPGKLVVVLGGDGKGQDFAPLAAPVQRHARAVALIGRDAALIEAAIRPAIGAAPHQRFQTLPEAVAWCFEQAQAGDAVLLSPACASMDMFRDYTHRAEVFVNAVQALAADRGVIA